MKKTRESIGEKLFKGTVSRARYFLFGFSLLLLKTGIDWAVARVVFQKPARNYLTTLQSYYFLGDTFGSLESVLLGRGEWVFNLTLLVLSLPFMLMGLSLTLKRLNALRIHPWVLTLFFIPFVQLLFFILLSIVPSSKKQPVSQLSRLRGDWLSKKLPLTPYMAGFMAAILTALFGGFMVLFSTDLLRSYGGFLFVGLPFCLGFLATLLYSPDHEVSLKEDFIVTLFSLFLVVIVMMACYLEGLICILMATPLVLGLAFLGVLCARAIRQSYGSHKGSQLLLLAVLLPSLMGFESAVGLKPTEWHVTSSVVIQASPEKVWEAVVAFPDIPQPKELLFRLGIAYPTHATIQGQGIGAKRLCHFNTGDFVEPITQWEEPKVLGFGVTSQPEPMTELSFYSNLHPPHLIGYFVSNRGEFRLTALPGEETLLEGTTWYTHAIWPEMYWHLWSNEIIHQIHLRVLNHIKRITEAS